ncbi:non-homologous end joining protein Ku [Caulobacter endophyticus]|uniref:Non-homologous end joining protein Ku n=1 Tax=Caulobacter endophyticus TaxID=2172652 RepID=A0A2T9JU14_9CAUL|nr:Ku protein [Caulobacter endophyticus]PVM87166.1 Ku protein [Caulobacter endophyticus]
MAPRPTWQGHLRLSLVTCPVALYTATNPGGEVRFNLLHPKTHNRIRMVATDPDLGPVERSDLVKGYEVEKDRYVIVTPEEIESVRLESTRTIDIERFVDVADIDRLYWDNPYFLVPDGKLAVEAYSVIRDAMAGAKRIALGRVVMHTRERLLAIEPRGKGLVAYSLRSFDEVRDPADLFDDIPARKADPAMIAIARKIIEQQDGPFEPKDFKDRYEEALRDLIKRKEKGGKTKVAAAPPEDTNVVDLMEALRKSLGGKASTTKSPAKKAAPKKAASAKTKKAS